MAKEKQAKAKPDLRIRLPEELAEKIRATADEEDVSMNTVMVQRLQRSFDDQTAALEALELSLGPDLAALLLMVGKAMHQTGTSAGVWKAGIVDGRWFADRWAFEEAVKAAQVMLSLAAPEGEPVAPKSRFPSDHRHHGKDLEHLADIGQRNAVHLARELSAPQGKQGEFRTWSQAIMAMSEEVPKRIARTLKRWSK